MPQNLIILPVMAQVALTFAVFIVMALTRRASIARRRQNLQDLALATEKDWDEPALQASNCYKNQFETPILFYVVTAFALMTRMVDPVLFGLACLFVATRIVHAIIHIGVNRVAGRGAAFFVGVLVLIAMWIILGWRVAAAGF
jgi:hypothetical protein